MCSWSPSKDDSYILSSCGVFSGTIHPPGFGYRWCGRDGVVAVAAVAVGDCFVVNCFAGAVVVAIPYATVAVASVVASFALLAVTRDIFSVSQRRIFVLHSSFGFLF